MTAAAPAAPIEVLEDTGDEIQVRFPVLALEGVDTGDGRFIELDGLTHRALPVSLLAQPYTSHGGQEPPPAVVFGNITSLTPRPGSEVISPRTGEPYGENVRVWTGEGQIDGTHEYAWLVRKKYLRGVSVDLADLNAEFVDEETAALSEHPRRQIIVAGAEIAGATMVPVPAFADAYVEIVGEEDHTPLAASVLPAELWTVPQPMWRSPELGDPGVGSLLQRTPSGNVTQKARDTAKKEGHTVPGTDSFPINTRQDVINAVKRAGSAKDPVKARKYIMREAKRLKATDVIPDQWNSDGTTKDDKAMTAAALAKTRPPLGLFTDPGLTGETPITIEDTDSGEWRRVYGHIGSWRRPHLGFNGQKIYPPKSRCDYAEFMRGGFRVDDQGTPRIVAVGHLTMDTGHADLSLAAASTAHHYDHTGFAWADVAAGEDQHGIWVSGVVKPWVTDEQLDVALAHPPSGDWRPIGAGLELVAVLCVNTPGFGIYRSRVASGQVQAMVASSGIPPRATTTPAGLDYDQLADALAARLETRQQRRASLTSQRAALLTELDDAPERMARVLADFPDDSEGDFTLTSEEITAFDIGRMPPQLRESYLHGKAAAKILWGQPGDFKRCELEATHHGIPKRMRAGMCATLHKEALGVAPGKEHGKK